jgi:hypothetical protein
MVLVKKTVGLRKIVDIVKLSPVVHTGAKFDAAPLAGILGGDLIPIFFEIGDAYVIAVANNVAHKLALVGGKRLRKRIDRQKSNQTNKQGHNCTAMPLGVEAHAHLMQV